MSDSLLCPYHLFLLPSLTEIRNQRENTEYWEMQKVDTFTVQNKTWDFMQTQEGNWQNWHIPATWNKMPSPPKSLWFPNLQDWGKKRRIKASSKWLCVSFIFTRKNRNLQNCYLQLCFLSLPSAKGSFHSFSKQVWQMFRHYLCLAV